MWEESNALQCAAIETRPVMAVWFVCWRWSVVMWDKNVVSRWEGNRSLCLASTFRSAQASREKISTSGLDMNSCSLLNGKPFIMFHVKLDFPLLQFYDMKWYYCILPNFYSSVRACGIYLAYGLRTAGKLYCIKSVAVDLMPRTFYICSQGIRASSSISFLTASAFFVVAAATWQLAGLRFSSWRPCFHLLRKTYWGSSGWKTLSGGQPYHTSSTPSAWRRTFGFSSGPWGLVYPIYHSLRMVHITT